MYEVRREFVTPAALIGIAALLAGATAIAYGVVAGDDPLWSARVQRAAACTVLNATVVTSVRSKTGEPGAPKTMSYWPQWNVSVIGYERGDACTGALPLCPATEQSFARYASKRYASEYVAQQYTINRTYACTVAILRESDYHDFEYKGPWWRQRARVGVSGECNPVVMGSTANYRPDWLGMCALCAACAVGLLLGGVALCLHEAVRHGR